MALRMAGRAGEALEQLDAALADLSRPGGGRAYARSTELFLRYERARALLDLDRPREAIAEAVDSLELAESIGWSPLPGALRTLVWALRAVGRDDEAVEPLARLRELAASPKNELARAVLAEAEGRPRSGGVVF
jgi:tetratricopeptide (TPR) repeat protein